MAEQVIPTLSQIAELQLIVLWLEHKICVTEEQRSEIVECSNPECEYCKDYL